MTDTPDPQPITATVLSSTAGADKLVLHLQLNDQLAEAVQRGTILAFSVQESPRCTCNFPLPDHDDDCPRRRPEVERTVLLPSVNLPYMSPERLAGLMHAAAGTLGPVAYEPNSCTTCSRAETVYRSLCEEGWAAEGVPGGTQALAKAANRPLLHAVGLDANRVDAANALAFMGDRLGLALASGEPWPEGFLVVGEECTNDRRVWLTGDWSNTLSILRSLYGTGWPSHGDTFTKGDPMPRIEVVSWRMVRSSYAWHVLPADALVSIARAEAHSVLLQAAAFEVAQ